MCSLEKRREAAKSFNTVVHGFSAAVNKSQENQKAAGVKHAGLHP